MTVIAWDGKTLAADRMVVSGGVKRMTTKIHRVDGDLFGISGCLAIGMARLQWVRDGLDPSAYPVAKDDSEWGQMLRIGVDGRIMLYNLNGVPMVFEDSCYAIGSGSDFALAAIHLGRDAEAAVRVACALSHECGMGIDTLEL
jgi:ATP-dependent protease HslVU (ClpYQ) peptidase subunit